MSPPDEKTMTDYKCPRCAADPKPEGFADSRQCAFMADGSFRADNWNCATIDALLGPSPQIVSGDNEQCEITPTWLDDGESDDYGGWIVTTRYKRRGRTDSAVYVGQFHPPQALTLAFADRVLQSRGAYAEWHSKHGMP